jgi:hypothetical protein
MLLKRIDWDELKEVLKEKYDITTDFDLVLDGPGLVLQIKEDEKEVP